TTRIRLMTGAVIPAFTHPLQLAGRLAMLDNLSHGRLDAGFGRAFLPQEFEAFEVPIDQSRSRFIEGVEAVRQLLTGEELTWSGAHHRFGPLSMLPPPVQKPHPPIWVAATLTAESFTWAGRQGYHLMTVPHASSRENIQRLLGLYRQAWRAGGHEAGRERIQISYQCLVAEDGDEARARARPYFESYSRTLKDAVSRPTSLSPYPGYEGLAAALDSNTFDRAVAKTTVLVGSPADVIAQLRQVQAWYGDVEVSLQVNFATLGMEDASRTVTLLADEAMPFL
ncbi:MAG: flavin-dependent oxidoreductase, partial [Candidatus Aeolococcus gillhamiae]